MDAELDAQGLCRSPAVDALSRLSAAVDGLAQVMDDGGADHLDDASLVALMQHLERCRNRLSIVDHRLIAAGERGGLPSVLGQPSMRQVLVQLLRLSPGEASRRVTATEACGERITALGEVLAPVRPVLAAAQRAGLVSSEQVQIVASALAKVDRPGIDRGDVEAGERLLCDFAVTFGAKDLRQLAERTVDAMDPDGTLPDEQLSLDRRHLTVRQCRDGMYAGDFRMTGAAGAKLISLLQPLSQPQIDNVPGPDGVLRREVDGRSYGQRAHDALEDMCDRLLRTGQLSGVSGTPATVIVTVKVEDLIDRVGYGTTSDGTLIPVPQLLKLASEAEIVPAVVDSAGAVLNLGRTRRIATTAQTHALIARDHGCSFPGCDRAPEWCERHHIVEWINGGPTDLDNLTLLCRFHHHNYASRGWRCQLNADRLPEWIPPRWLDRQQRPLINSRIAAQLHAWRQRRARPGARARSGGDLVGAVP
ncbi:MAG TPA: DUF222 domain-containing protein [Propionibacteriaceae bacterium]|nr:DUF222 domain-containing protein [Propionibacteriaceae bacterium]